MSLKKHISDFLKKNFFRKTYLRLSKKTSKDYLLYDFETNIAIYITAIIYYLKCRRNFKIFLRSEFIDITHMVVVSETKTD